MRHDSTPLSRIKELYTFLKGNRKMVRIENLVKRFATKYAVNDLSLHIGKGEILGFLGPNGSGKSTTMNVITGYIAATSGEVYIDGINILDNPVKVKTLIGYLPEQPPLYPEMTVREYLNFVFDLKKCTFNRTKHINEICSIIKIKDVQNRVIRNLSKGYKQRVGIAQALIGNPPLLIFDEPTVGLDPKEIIEIRSLIRRLGQNHTVILSTHILSEVQAVCDRVVIIESGNLMADKPIDEIAETVENKRRYSIKVCGPTRDVTSLIRELDGVRKVEADGESDDGTYTYTVECLAGADIRKPLFYALSKNNYPLMGLEELKASLEDIFIAIVDSKYEKVGASKQKRASWDDEGKEE